MSAVEKALAPGTLLHEYRIDEVLGTGTFGITYKATDTNLSIPVAIKEFLPHQFVERAADGRVTTSRKNYDEVYQWGLARFVGEAQVLAQFKHTNIVRVARYFPEHGTAYIVMDFEDGGSLHEYLEGLQEEVNEALLKRIFIPVLDGLREVHSKHYLHRDIKPGNIYMRSHGPPMLIDFGAARMEMGGQQETANVLTPGYAPPEQYCQDNRQGPPSDLYSLGATLYRCITGSTPCEASERMDAVAARRPDPLEAAVDFAGDRFSRAFLESVDAMMRLVYEDRPQSVDALLAMWPESRLPEPSTSIFYQATGIQHKVLITGSHGAGKSTAVRTLSHTQVVDTDEPLADGSRTTTVAMDFGERRLDSGVRVRLFGTPGLERFDFMVARLLPGADGAIILVDNRHPNPMRELDRHLNLLRDFIEQRRFMIGITHCDEKSLPGTEQYYAHLQRSSRRWLGVPPVFEVDPRRLQDMSLALESLLTCIDPGVEDYDI